MEIKKERNSDAILLEAHLSALYKSLWRSYKGSVASWELSLITEQKKAEMLVMLYLKSHYINIMFLVME